MLEKFDPYHQWLGIPATEQPPHHYRLLGITPFEESPAVIENAADRQMAHLRTFQTGKHAAESQRLLNEVAAAKLCLLNPQKKTAYDRSLRQRLPASNEPAGDSTADAIDAELAAVFATPISSTSGIAAKGRRKKSQPTPMALVIAAVLTVLAVGLAGMWWAFGRGDEPGDGRVAKVIEPATPTTPPKAASPKMPDPSRKDAPTSASMEPRKTLRADDASAAPVLKPAAPEAAAQAKPQSKEDETTEPKPAAKDSAAEKTESNEEKAPTTKLAPPAVGEQKRLMGEIDEIYKPGDAKDQAAKAALARKLLDDGRKNEANRAEQFVLLRRAGEVARDAGEANLMLEAVDAMAEAGFDIRPIQVKSRLLKHLVDQGPLGGASQLSTICASCVKFAEEAAAGGEVDESLEVLDAAGKRLPKLVSQAQAAARHAAIVALARTRTPAEKAEWEKKSAVAQAELDEIKSAQSALAECAKGLQRAKREHEVIREAEERLKTDPNDVAACLALGRWYCFQQGNWDDGLKLLAKGSDAALKSAAAEELASKPSKAEDKVVRGDAWWDLAEKADAKTRAAMRQRAAHWYQEALPDLAPSLGKSRVERRLAQVDEGPLPAAERPSAGTHPPLAVAPFNEKAAKQHQARWAKHLHVLVVQTNSIGMKLVLIPPGEFQMGSPKELIEEELRLHDGVGWYPKHLPGEGLQHRVRITKPYWLGATDVTQEEYQRVMGSNPSKFQGDPQRPVEQVSWDDAVEFCRKLSALPGEKAAKRRYGLPTEAQWEYACRAGTTTRWYAGGNEAGLADVAWFDKNAGGQTHSVGHKGVNAWGLYDMHGNVWEWCQDWYDKEYYAKSPMDDPAGPHSDSARVFRGGCWIDGAGYCRSAYRNGSRPGLRDCILGFRVSQVLADK